MRRTRSRAGRWGIAALAAACLLSGSLLGGDHCDWAPPSDAVVEAVWSQGPLRVGGGRAPFALPARVQRAGYSGAMPEVATQGVELGAEALVLAVEDRRLALVSVDLLLIPESLQAAVRERIPATVEVVLVATHTHSGPGGFDGRRIAGWAGAGSPRAEVAEAVVSAAVAAVDQATRNLAPAAWSWGSGPVPGLNRSRAPGTPVSSTLTWLRFVTAGATHALVVHAAHPTLFARGEVVLDADHPGRLALHEGAGVTIALQGAGGNASVPAGPGNATERGLAQVQAVEAAVRGMSAQEGAPWSERSGPPAAGAAVREAVGPSVEAGSAGAGAADASGIAPGAGSADEGAGEAVTLGQARVRLGLPRPDASRLVAPALRGPTEGLLCSIAPRTAELSLWQLGGLRLLFAPAEVTGAVEPGLLGAGGATAVVTLADGYVGYAESAANLAAMRGEAKRQVFGPALAERLADGSRLAARALEEARPATR